MKNIFKSKYINIIFLSFLFVALILFIISCFYHYSGTHNIWTEAKEWKIERDIIEKTYSSLDKEQIAVRKVHLNAISSAYNISTIILTIFMPFTILTIAFLLTDMLYKTKSDRAKAVFEISLIISFFFVITTFVISILVLTNTLNVLDSSWIQDHIDLAKA